MDKEDRLAALLAKQSVKKEAEPESEPEPEDK